MLSPLMLHGRTSQSLRNSFELLIGCFFISRNARLRLLLGTVALGFLLISFPSVGAGHQNTDLSHWRTVEVPADATKSLGAWIWAKTTSDKQICQLWKAFVLPAGAKVTKAQLRITADNGYRLFLDGRELGQGTEWRALTEYDISQLLPPGAHTLGIVAFNDFLQAGVIFGLQIELADGQVIQIPSDESWRIVPNTEADWQTRTQAPADWENAKAMAAEDKPSMWWSDHPLDFVVVPPFKPIILPFWHQAWFHVTLITVSPLVFLACILLITQLIIQNKEQRLLHIERSRIARDIHDDVGTRLTKLVLQGEVAQSTLSQDSPMRGQFDGICSGLRDVLDAMDEVLWAVNPRQDTLLDFITHICDHAQTFLQSTNIQCQLDIEPDIPAVNFDLPLRRSLALVIKEVLSNAAKHSGASQLVMKIWRNGPRLMIVVEDNGKGFELDQVNPQRNGLRNALQRTSEAGGECQIRSRPGAGCRVEFSIPFVRRSPGNWFFRRRSIGSKNSLLEPETHSPEQSHRTIVNP